MMTVRDGQCGLCTHFGESADGVRSPRLVEILSTRQASEEMLAACGNRKLAGLHLRVTPGSGCDGFERAT